MRVTISLRAEAAIEAAAAYLMDGSVRAGIRLGERLFAACHSLSSMPARCPLYPGFEGHGIRRLAEGRYSIFYVVRSDDVLVFHILHERQDARTILRNAL